MQFIACHQIMIISEVVLSEPLRRHSAGYCLSANKVWLQLKKSEMIKHIELGPTAGDRTKALGSLIRKGEITLGGYRRAKIFGLLSCRSGKRMKAENRVFFKSEAEAIAAGYRPCGHCMKAQ